MKSNPFPTRVGMNRPGGSSSGAAAALAARLLPVADGSDMMGSLRNPAAFNNVHGFRPSAGRIPPNKSAYTCSLPLATNGPMERSNTDIVLLLNTLCASEPSPPWSLPEETSFIAALNADATPSLTGQHIAWIGDANGQYPMEDDVRELCQSAVDTLEALGCHVQSINIAIDLHELFDAWCT